MTTEEQEQIVYLEQLLDKLYNKRTEINKTIKQARKELNELMRIVTLHVTYNKRSKKYILSAREPRHKPVYITGRKSKQEIQEIYDECRNKTMTEIWDIKEKYRLKDSKSSKRYGGTLY